MEMGSRRVIPVLQSQLSFAFFKNGHAGHDGVLFASSLLLPRSRSLEEVCMYVSVVRLGTKDRFPAQDMVESLRVVSNLHATQELLPTPMRE